MTFFSFFPTLLTFEESRKDFPFISLPLVLAWILHSDVADDISSLFCVSTRVYPMIWIMVMNKKDKISVILKINRQVEEIDSKQTNICLNINILNMLKINIKEMEGKTQWEESETFQKGKSRKVFLSKWYLRKDMNQTLTKWSMRKENSK